MKRQQHRPPKRHHHRSVGKNNFLSPAKSKKKKRPYKKQNTSPVIEKAPALKKRPLPSFVYQALQPLEKVIWYGSPEDRKINNTVIVNILTGLILLALVISLTGKIMFISILILPIAYLFYKGILTYQNSNFNLVYLTTNHRIMIIDKKQGVISENMLYSKIYKIERTEKVGVNKITFKEIDYEEQPRKKRPCFKNLKTPDKVYRILQKQFKKTNASLAINKKYQELALSHALNYKPAKSKKQSTAVLSGKIKEHDVHIEIKNLLPVSRLKISINCPNAEDNFFTLTEEVSTDNVAKLFGKQDIQTGYLPFDHKFLLKSDNQYFTLEVFPQKTQQHLVETNKNITGEYRFGTEKAVKRLKKEKRIFKDDLRVLDLHLLKDKITDHKPAGKATAKTGQMTLLTCQYDLTSGNVKTKDNSNQILSLINKNLKAMLLLAEDIRKYEQRF